MVALFKIPVEKNSNSSGLIVALDAINDPGNLGTIIRLCDWFGVDKLLCSKETVDCYNTKIEMEKHNRYFQICMPTLEPFKVKIVESLDKTMRGEGGHGSTGK